MILLGEIVFSFEGLPKAMAPIMSFTLSFKVCEYPLSKLGVAVVNNTCIGFARSFSFYQIQMQYSELNCICLFYNEDVHHHHLSVRMHD